MAKQADRVRRVRMRLGRSHSSRSGPSTGNIGLGIVIGLIVVGVTMLLMKVTER